MERKKESDRAKLYLKSAKAEFKSYGGQFNVIGNNHSIDTEYYPELKLMQDKFYMYEYRADQIQELRVLVLLLAYNIAINPQYKN